MIETAKHIAQIRTQFPILSEFVGKYPLVYLDNAATTQKPQITIDQISAYYEHSNSNIHRGAHHLANKATEHYEETRSLIAQYINAIPSEVNFTRGTTESINLLAYSWGLHSFKHGDNVIISEMEHHANIVPWLFLKDMLGIEVRYIPMRPDATLDISILPTLIDDRTQLISIAYISNAMGTIHPINEVIQIAKSKGIKVHLDAAQAIQHLPINVQALDIDFMSFSAHKLYGPMGIGVFWGKTEHLEAMKPFQYGGEMIREVFMDHATFNTLPYKFEAGTPNVADVIALGTSIKFLNQIGFEVMQQIESNLYHYLYKKLESIQDLTIYSPKDHSIAALSFNVVGIHPYDLGQLLNAKGIAIRTGHHCCQPLMRKLGIEGTCRASLAIYNTFEEIDFFAEQLKKSIHILR